MKACFWILSAAVLLSGCLGKDNVAFVTDTTIGIDLDAKPVKTSIGYARFEGVLEPQFEDGRLLPVVSSINAQLGLSVFGNGQSFATGASAVVLADGTGKAGNYFGADFHHKESLKPDELNRADGSLDPAKKNFGPDTIITSIGMDQRKTIVFTTLTNFSLNIEWDSGGIPTAMNLGYKRKEIAFTPFEERFIDKIPAKDKDGKPIGSRAITIPSLLATANIASDMSNKTKLNIAIGQLFATGASATYLSANEGVRDLMGSLLLKNYDEIKSSKTADPAVAQATIDQVVTQYGTLNAAKQASSIDAAIKLKLLDAADKTAAGAAPLTPDVFRSHLAAHVNPLSPTDQKTLNDLLTQMKAL